MSDCFVYAMMSAREDAQHRNRVKVGISDNPESRFATIKTSCPFVLDYMGLWRLPDRATAFAIERRFHKANARWRTNGEWFAMYGIAASIEIDDICLRYWMERTRSFEAVRLFAKFVGIDHLESFEIEWQAEQDELAESDA